MPQTKKRSLDEILSDLKNNQRRPKEIDQENGTFDLSNHKNGKKGELGALAAVCRLRRDIEIKQLDLSGRLIVGEHYDLLKLPHLESLFLLKSSFSQGGLQALTKALSAKDEITLKNETTFTCLALWIEKEFSDHAIALAQAIGQNKTLTQLHINADLAGNPDFVEALKKNTSITELVLIPQALPITPDSMSQPLKEWLADNRKCAAIVKLGGLSDDECIGKLIPHAVDKNFTGYDFSGLKQLPGAVGNAIDYRRGNFAGRDLSGLDLSCSFFPSPSRPVLYYLYDADFSGANLTGVKLDIRSAYLFCTRTKGLSETFKKTLEVHIVKQFQEAYENALGKKSNVSAKIHTFFATYGHPLKDFMPLSLDVTLEGIVAHVNSLNPNATQKSLCWQLCCGPNAIKIEIPEIHEHDLHQAVEVAGEEKWGGSVIRQALPQGI